MRHDFVTGLPLVSPVNKLPCPKVGRKIFGVLEADSSVLGNSSSRLAEDDLSHPFQDRSPLPSNSELQPLHSDKLGLGPNSPVGVSSNISLNLGCEAG